MPSDGVAKIVSAQLKVILADLYIETSWREMSILKFQVRERKKERYLGIQATISLVSSKRDATSGLEATKSIR